MQALAVPPLLERVRAACDGPLVVMKGPEVAARYAEPSTRPFRDLDLLACDAAAVQRSLLDAGFQVAGEPELYVDIHHLRPLYWPGLPLVIEVHQRPKWPAGLARAAHRGARRGRRAVRDRRRRRSGPRRPRTTCWPSPRTRGRTCR